MEVCLGREKQHTPRPYASHLARRWSTRELGIHAGGVVCYILGPTIHTIWNSFTHLLNKYFRSVINPNGPNTNQNESSCNSGKRHVFEALHVNMMATTLSSPTLYYTLMLAKRFSISSQVDMWERQTCSFIWLSAFIFAFWRLRLLFVILTIAKPIRQGTLLNDALEFTHSLIKWSVYMW